MFSFKVSKVSEVTLHVSVWVEIDRRLMTLRGNVSRSTWACELKWRSIKKCSRLSGHAPRERVSWNTAILQIARNSRVTLHVSVWVEMKLIASNLKKSTVTLHVSVWVEILFVSFSALSRPSRSTWACELKLHGCWWNDSRNVVTLHVSVWVEITMQWLDFSTLGSRSTWACELKSYGSPSYIRWIASRSTWACELKFF